jgi:hypothetical protein
MRETNLKPANWDKPVAVDGIVDKYHNEKKFSVRFPQNYRYSSAQLQLPEGMEQKDLPVGSAITVEAGVERIVLLSITGGSVAESIDLKKSGGVPARTVKTFRAYTHDRRTIVDHLPGVEYDIGEHIRFGE